MSTQMIKARIIALARTAFLRGKIEGIRDYAIWKNGEQVVGCLQTPLHEVLGPYEREIQVLTDHFNLTEAK